MGEVFAGRYELADPIGRGGVGAVWRAWDHRRRRYVAAKVLQQSDAHTLLRFVREQALRIDHPHVLAPASWAADDDKVLFTMDLVRGGSLAHLIGDYGPLPPRLVSTLIDQLLSGLAAVHAEGVIHRDIKPANILLEATGSRPVHLRLSDFGISMRKGEPRLTETDYVVGTPGYFAPEQMLGGEPDFPADLFAVGLVALYLLQGAKPDARALIEHFADRGTPGPPKGVPAPLWQVVAGLLQPDPDHRFRTATGARKALLSAAEMLPEPAVDEEAVEVFDQLGPLPPEFGSDGPLHGRRPGRHAANGAAPLEAGRSAAAAGPAPDSTPGPGSSASPAAGFTVPPVPQHAPAPPPGPPAGTAGPRPGTGATDASQPYGSSGTSAHSEIHRSASGSFGVGSSAKLPEAPSTPPPSPATAFDPPATSAVPAPGRSSTPPPTPSFPTPGAAGTPSAPGAPGVHEGPNRGLPPGSTASSGTPATGMPSVHPGVTNTGSGAGTFGRDSGDFPLAPPGETTPNSGRTPTGPPPERSTTDGSPTGGSEGPVAGGSMSGGAVFGSYPYGVSAGPGQAGSVTGTGPAGASPWSQGAGSPQPLADDSWTGRNGGAWNEGAPWATGPEASLSGPSRQTWTPTRPYTADAPLPVESHTVTSPPRPVAPLSRRRRRPGPPTKVTLSLLAAAAVSFAVGTWALLNLL